jgi:hypothetical protein
MSGVVTFAPGTLLMAALLTVLTSSQGLLTAASKTGGGYAYDFATVPFLAELTKLCISYFLLERQRAADPASIRVTRDWRTVALFIVPSIIYMFHNNVQVWGLCAGGGGARGGGASARVRGGHAGAISMLGRCPCKTGARSMPPSARQLSRPAGRGGPSLQLPPSLLDSLPRSFSSSSTWTLPPTRSWAT